MSLYRQAAAIAVFCGALTASAQYNVTTLFLQGSKIPNSNNTWNVNPGTIPTMPLSISASTSLLSNVPAIPKPSPPTESGCSIGPPIPSHNWWRPATFQRVRVKPT